MRHACHRALLKAEAPREDPLSAGRVSPGRCHRGRPAGSPRPLLAAPLLFHGNTRCFVYDVTPEAFQLEGVAACPVSSFLKHSLRTQH